MIIGIDPGSIKTGWGIIESIRGNLKCVGFGVIYLPEKSSLATRLGVLATQLNEVIERFNPTAMSVEKIFLAKNADSAFKLGHARGVALALAGQRQLEMGEYATRHVKKMLTGTGSATKEQVQFMIGQMFRVQVNELDATDALALAVCHARKAEVEAMFMEQKNLQTKERDL